MARVDFYVLSQSGQNAELHFACRLAEKAYRHEHSVQILTASEQVAGMLDNLLWTFRDGSFVPHECIYDDTSAADSPVLISTAAGALRDPGLLINLSRSLPPGIDALPRIAELVTSDEDARAAGRQRFTEYRNLGHELETHKV
ncbi:MAG: DNA polymerase III subunit chi [Pseudomonadota bacterium]